MNSYRYPFVGPPKNYIRKDYYPLSQSLNKKNGFMVVKTSETADEPFYQTMILSKSLNDISLVDRFYDNLGNFTSESKKPFQPKFVELDKKVLKFFAYFIDPVYESLTEIHRIRSVSIYYYLLDDVISVVEPMVDNSGLIQGKIFIRQKVPSSDDATKFITWQYFNIGQNVEMFGRSYTITDSDSFTKDYFETQGLRLNEPETIPTDPYLFNMQQKLNVKNKRISSSKRRYAVEPLVYFAVWDDKNGDDYNRIWRRVFLITYFDHDDTFLIRELSDKFDGLTPLLINRQKLRKGTGSFSSSNEYLSHKDLAIGNWIDINGRAMFIFDCHKNTRNLLAISEDPIDLNKYPPGQLPIRIKEGNYSDRRLPDILTFIGVVVNGPAYLTKISSFLIEYSVDTKCVEIWENVSTERATIKGRLFIGKSPIKLQ